MTTFNYLFGATIVAHWFSDFFSQTQEMSVKKSKSALWLTYHVSVYTGAMSFLLMFCGVLNAWLSVLIFVTHWITDFITSKITSRLWKKATVSGDYHNFFVVVGVDQMIHILTLWVLAIIFMRN